MNLSRLHIGLASAALRRLAFNYEADASPPRLPPSGPRWQSDGKGTLHLFDSHGATAATFQFLPPHSPQEIRVIIQRDGFASLVDDRVENDSARAIGTTFPEVILALKALP